MSKVAIVTGILGQDGGYLSEQLLSLGYEVVGIYKRVSTGTHLENANHIKNHSRLKLIEGDITDAGFIFSVIKTVQPSEFYNLAAMSHVGQSFKEPQATFRVNAEAVLLQLEAIRLFSPHTKYYQASTSELYGGLNCPTTGYTEKSPFHPRSPYAVAKQAAFHTVVNYREAYGLFACNGILFNHSSPSRGLDFATRKITSGIARCKLGLQSEVAMGNLKAARDEGHSGDYCTAMRLMLEQPVPDDYVVATGVSTTIEDMFKYVCDLAKLDFDKIYKEDQRFMRPSEVPFLLGDASKIKKLGWKPIYTWKMLLKEMYLADLNKLSNHP